MTVSRARVRRVPVRPVQERFLKPLERRDKVKSQVQPRLLRKLQIFKAITVGTTLLLTGCVFVVYSWSVRSQKEWDQQYKKLEYLKQMEAKLINATEALDHERVQSAWDGNNFLTRETPTKTLFLEAMPPRPPIVTKEVEQPRLPQAPISY